MLSAIVVNFRSSPLVDQCVRSLLAGSRCPDEIVVIDNEGRTDESHGGLSPDLAGSELVRVHVVAGNPGYAASCNLGADLATGDQLLFLNADVTLDADCLERCIAALEADPGVGIITPRLERPDGRLDHACHRGLPTPLASFAYKLRLHRLVPGSRRLARYTMAWLDPSTDHDIESCAGAFLLISRHDLVAAGGWDERYRFYGEDLDLCLRVGRLGRRVRYLGTVRATHLKAAFSFHDRADRTLDASQREVKRWAEREIVASHRLFFEEHVRADSPAPARWAIQLMFALQALRSRAADRLARA